MAAVICPRVHLSLGQRRPSVHQVNDGLQTDHCSTDACFSNLEVQDKRKHVETVGSKRIKQNSKCLSVFWQKSVLRFNKRPRSPDEEKLENIYFYDQRVYVTSIPADQ